MGGGPIRLRPGGGGARPFVLRPVVTDVLDSAFAAQPTRGEPGNHGARYTDLAPQHCRSAPRRDDQPCTATYLSVNCPGDISDQPDHPYDHTRNHAADHGHHDDDHANNDDHDDDHHDHDDYDDYDDDHRDPWAPAGSAWTT